MFSVVQYYFAQTSVEIQKSKSQMREKGVLGNLLMSPTAEGKRCSESWDFGLDGPHLLEDTMADRCKCCKQKIMCC